MKADYLESPEQVLEKLESTRNGLPEEEASRRLERDGRNRLAEAKHDSLLKRFMLQLADPMILMLLAAAVVSAFTAHYAGESAADVYIILTVVIINAVLGVLQESKAEKSLEALQAMAAAQCRVLRGGTVRVIPSETLVVGDVILLEAGDAVPADARILECATLKTEEAALTGESLPVLKQAEAMEQGGAEISLGDRRNMLWSGSSVVYGRGRAVVTATGMQTEMGRIADALARTREGKTPLQKKLAQLSRILTAVVLAISVIVFIVGILRAGQFSGAVALHSFMIAVSLAVAAIPEGLAAVVTIVLSIGVTNMSRHNAIIRKLTAVETLGCAQIICSDKTGTLTQNRMTVVESWGSDTGLLARIMTQCSDAVLDPESGDVVGEPTESALVAWAAKENVPQNVVHAAEPRIGEAPFDSGRKRMSTVHRTEDGFIQYTKGAPDELLKVCDTILIDGEVLPLTEERRAAVLEANRSMTQKALRVLGGAFRRWEAEPADYAPAALEQGLCMVGLTGMIDPVRPEAVEAIAECRRAGIRPIMITGDHADTATAIARELGILGPDESAVSGAELNAMDDAEFEQRVTEIHAYARVQPEHKTRIVNAWQKRGCVTAMTGDGVNDAPSIKAADIGVGMGITGTDVTKNAADMVLADDNFATIVGAVEEGRRIYDNIQKAVKFLLSSNLSEVLSIFFATLLGFTILEPVHLLWINLLTDTFPALALGTEPAETNVMSRPPRDPKAGIFSGGVAADVLYQGAFVTLLTMAAYLIGHYLEAGVWALTNSPAGTTMAFLTMSMAEIFHSFNVRAHRRSIFALKRQNKRLLLAAAVSLILTAAVVLVPFLAEMFGFVRVRFTSYLTSLALAFLIIPLVELVKLFQRHETK